MEEQNINQSQTVNFWKPLHTFYTTNATMKISLIDSDGSVAITIAPSFPDVNGRPQAGQKRYDYSKQMTFKLSVVEMQAVIMGYRMGIYQNDQVSFLHMKGNGSAVLGSVSSYNNRLQFSIRELVQGGAVQNYAFNNLETKKDSKNYIPAEFELFLSILEGVINNLVFLKSGLLKEYIPQNRQNQHNNYANNYNQNNSNSNNYNKGNYQNNYYNNQNNQQNHTQHQNMENQQNNYRQAQQYVTNSNTTFDDNELGF